MKLTRIDGHLALVFDPDLLEATGIDAETPLEISTDGDVIVISPQRSVTRDEKLRKTADGMHERYAGVFRRLASDD